LIILCTGLSIGTKGPNNPHSPYSITDGKVTIAITDPVTGAAVKEYILDKSYTVVISSNTVFTGYVVGANPTVGSGGGGDITATGQNSQLLDCAAAKQ
jgi:hypothetical protein